MKWRRSKQLLILCALTTLSACTAKAPADKPSQSEQGAVAPPEFSADSAYAYIAHQVSFGPRVPGSAAQVQCATWLEEQLRRFGAEVIVQRSTVTVADGSTVPCFNVIGQYQPEARRRLLLAAHWDTRPWADQDVTNTNQPIDGANDGASGVGVLLEVARQLMLRHPEAGIDIIFFDVEDSGVSGMEDSYCLGSQYWAKQPVPAGYKADKGILLDMVGARNATFSLEGTSMRIAPDFMRYVWNMAHDLGHGKYFLFKETPPIIDDHLYVYRYARIPMIDIIHYEPGTSSGFGRYWHTHQDNMDIIHKPTLQAVGETVLAVIYDF
jgi:glutaminyl-peptide cyclotransferase